MEGNLVTKDYKHFEVVDDLGKTLLVFEGAANANKALPGDAVRLESDGKVSILARAPPLLIAGTLELNSKTTYGMTKQGHPLYLFEPLNTAYPSFVVGSSERDRSSKKLGLIKFHSWDQTTLPRGSLERLLGDAGDWFAEEEALLWSVCPYKSLTEGLVVLGDDCPKRTVIKGFTCNIDPEGCRDIDDCVTFEEIDEDTWRVTITISDVASCIAEMEAIDLMAATFCQTLYRDGVPVRPMLPPFFSEDHCSLKAGTERRGVSLSFCWRRGETIFGEEWSESTIQNNATYNYESVHEPMAILLKGCTSQIANRSITDPHEWIEVLMKFYNTKAAMLLREAGTGILRRHSEPDRARLDKYTAWDPSLSVLANSASEYCLADDPEVQHWGLGEAAYCHATSPIRRYADLMNQRILKQLIRNNKDVMVTVLCSELNKAAKAAKGYERDRQFLKCLLKDEERTFRGRVLDLEPKEDGKCAVRIWVPAWNRSIKTRMRLLEQTGGGVLVGSADETAVFELREGQEIVFDCAMNLLGKRWKDRLVIQIKSE